MRGGEMRRRRDDIEWLRVETSPQDRFHGAIADRAGGARAPTRRLQPRGVIAPLQREETETGAIALLGMRVAREQALDHLRRRRPDAGAPRDQARRRPLDVAVVRFGAMPGIGREAALECTARVHRDARVAVQDLHRGRGEPTVTVAPVRRYGTL